MARIAGVTLPNDKRIVIALTYILGIGNSRSMKILKEIDIDQNIKTKDLDDAQVKAISEQVGKYQVEGELRRSVMGDIKRLKEIGCYRGERHNKRLPVRGQRTKTNSRTVRGNVRQTMGSGRRALTKT
ncbi:MAG: 30S ribosomal protein S13 [Candidatus Uhrbacteria bacterium]